MSEDSPRCPTCDGSIGGAHAHDDTKVVDQYCDACSALLRLRYFRGELVDVEDLDHAETVDLN